MDKVKHGYNSKQNWGDLPRLQFPKLEPPRFIELNGTLPTTQVYFACVCVGPKFPLHYVTRLKSMIQRATAGWDDWRFVCITDRSDIGRELGPHEAVNPGRALPGWYSKINLFNPEVFPAGSRVIYFDLDCVITGSLLGFVAAKEDFIMLREFNGGKPESANNSSIMAWTAGGPAREIYEQFEDDWMRRSWGDQECTWKIMGNDRIWNWPLDWARSYKWHGRQGIPQGCKVMVFHGDPKQDAVGDPWVKEMWQ